MKRCRDSDRDLIREERRSSGSRYTSMKEETTSSNCRNSGDNRTNNHRGEQKEDHKSKRESSRSRDRSTLDRSNSSRLHGNIRNSAKGNSPIRGDRSKFKKDPVVHERNRRRSKSTSVERNRSNRRQSRSRSRDRRSSKDIINTIRKVPERRRSRSRGSSRERSKKRNRSSERGNRRSRSRSRSLSPTGRHSNRGSSNIVVTGPDSKELTVHIPEPVKGLAKESPSSLPLNDFSKLSTGRLTTPQMALQQAMAAMNAKAQQMTGITLPKYYNPAAVNPLKYAEQMQKRKLLWSKKEKVVEIQSSNNNWEETAFAQDQDGRVAAKFKRLMGIKEEGSSSSSQPAPVSHLKKQEDLFKSLDQQYEQARVSTHTQRGVGLGYSAAVSSFTGAVPFNLLPPK